MTTKAKIIIGFTLMLAILGGVVFIAYRDLDATVSDFAEYRRVARLNTAASDTVAALNLFEGQIFKYVDGHKASDLQEAKGAIAAAGKALETALNLASHENTKGSLNKLKALIGDGEKDADAVHSTLAAAYSQYENNVQKANRELAAKLLTFAESARNVQSHNSAYLATVCMEKLTALRSTLGRFAEARRLTDGEKALEQANELNKAISDLEAVLISDEGRKLFAEIKAAAGDSQKAIQAMNDEYKKTNKALEDIRALVDTASAVAGTVNADVDAQAKKLGDNMTAASLAAQKLMLAAGGLGLIAAVICALVIVIGIARVLANLADFAGAVAKGDFSHELKIREGGEVGAMVAAMKQIPHILENVIEQAEHLSDRIAGGRLRDRLDEKALPGSFASLSHGFNTVASAYTGLLDNLPLPIMACDNNCGILFLNKPGIDALGGECTGEACAGHLNSPLCGTKDCMGRVTMGRKGAFSGETVINVRGKRMDVSVAAFPLQNLKKEVVGFIEILTDLTAIKEQQNAVMRAASEASEISDRIAAASEQLAAQVEQISRGAEVQRSRVESTASAMTEMNSTVMEVARNAGQASEQSDGTRKKAEDGAGLVNKVVQSINQVNRVAETLQTNMQELGKQAESIGGVMNVISDIADQTNLLALNAAIEAARAGEAGRGFAVVADEVRKLAEKTMHATQEVGSNIKAIQQSAQTNINEVGVAVESISDATGLANSSGTALKEIVDLASANSAIVASIATAAEEQSATSDEISHAIEEISHIVGETTDGMVQSSSAVQDLSRVAQELRRVMERLRG